MWADGIGRALLTALPPYLKAVGFSDLQGWPI